MGKFDIICVWIAELAPLLSALFAFAYGLKYFFRKGQPLHLQSVTMAMGCYALGSIYHSCQLLTNEKIFEGFTPAYLGRIGLFLFLITASYGQLDRIVDDGSPKLRSSRVIALLAPLAASAMYLPTMLMQELSFFTKLAVFLVWIPALFSLYFNLKHAIIPDLDYGFIKAIRPYNILAVCLGFAELLQLTAWNYRCYPFIASTAIIFGALCIVTVIMAKKGAEKWTI